MTTLAEQAHAFLDGDGRTIVRRNLRAQGLPAHLHDDVVQEVLLKVEAAERDGFAPHNLYGFVSTLVHRQTVDVLRGELRRPEGHIVDLRDDGPDPLEDLVGGDRPDDEVITAAELARLGTIVDDIRGRLAPRPCEHAADAAGALAVLAIVHGDAVPAEDCPAPVGGVAQSEAVIWAGVFYGGGERCFPTPDDPEDAAMRKRRSRAMRRLRQVLEAAAADLGAILEGDDA